MRLYSVPCPHASCLSCKTDAVVLGALPACFLLVLQDRSRGGRQEEGKRGMDAIIFGALPAYLKIGLREGGRWRSDMDEQAVTEGGE